MPTNRVTRSQDPQRPPARPKRGPPSSRPAVVPRSNARRAQASRPAAVAATEEDSAAVDDEEEEVDDQCRRKTSKDAEELDDGESAQEVAASLSAKGAPSGSGRTVESEGEGEDGSEDEGGVGANGSPSGTSERGGDETDGDAPAPRNKTHSSPSSNSASTSTPTKKKKKQKKKAPVSPYKAGEESDAPSYMRADLLVDDELLKGLFFARNRKRLAKVWCAPIGYWEEGAKEIALETLEAGGATVVRNKDLRIADYAVFPPTPPLPLDYSSDLERAHNLPVPAIQSIWIEETVLRGEPINPLGKVSYKVPGPTNTRKERQPFTPGNDDDLVKALIDADRQGITKATMFHRLGQLPGTDKRPKHDKSSWESLYKRQHELDFKKRVKVERKRLRKGKGKARYVSEDDVPDVEPDVVTLDDDEDSDLDVDLARDFREGTRMLELDNEGSGDETESEKEPQEETRSKKRGTPSGEDRETGGDSPARKKRAPAGR